MALDNIPTIGPGGLNANLDKVLVYKNGGSEVASSISTLVSYAARPSGVAGSIQFSDGSALASSSNLFWDNTNSRLGIGTNAPIYTADIAGNLRVTDGSFSLNYTGNSSNGSLINAGTYPSFKVTNAAGVIRAILGSDGPNGYLTLQENGTTYTYLTGTATGNAGYSYFLSQLGIGTATTLGAKLSIKGSGSTSATTSLLVQNSNGLANLQITDDGQVSVNNEGKFSVVRYGNTLLSTGQSTSSLSTYNSSVTVSNTQIAFNTLGNYGWAFLQDLFQGYHPMIIQDATYKLRESSAVVELNSKTRGFLKPKMTTAQKNAIVTPTAGLEIYDTDLNRPCFYNGTSWITL